MPDEMTSCGRILQFPPIPDIPEPLRGGSFTVVEVAFQGDRAAGDALIASLRALSPRMDTVDVIPPAALEQLHMDPPEPVPGSGDGVMLAGLPAEALDAFVAIAGPGSGSPLLSAELRHLGGALGRPAATGGALDHLSGEFIAFAVGMTPGPEMHEAVTAHVTRVQEALAPWAARSTYLNFAERSTDPARFFGAAVLERLRAVKATYDPQDLFHANHPGEVMTMNTSDRDFGALLAGLIELCTHAPLDPPPVPSPPVPPSPVPQPRDGAEESQTLVRSGSGRRAQ